MQALADVTPRDLARAWVQFSDADADVPLGDSRVASTSFDAIFGVSHNQTQPVLLQLAGEGKNEQQTPASLPDSSCKGS